jgi:hypothetical protein
MFHSSRTCRTWSWLGSFQIPSSSMGPKSGTLADHIVHDQKGAAGIFVNRPLDECPLATLLAALGERATGAAGRVRIFAGSLVQPDLGFFHTADFFPTPDADRGSSKVSFRNCSGLRRRRTRAGFRGSSRSALGERWPAELRIFDSWDRMVCGGSYGVRPPPRFPPHYLQISARDSAVKGLSLFELHFLQKQIGDQPPQP